MSSPLVPPPIPPRPRAKHAHVQRVQHEAFGPSAQIQKWHKQVKQDLLALYFFCKGRISFPTLLLLIIVLVLFYSAPLLVSHMSVQRRIVQHNEIITQINDFQHNADQTASSISSDRSDRIYKRLTRLLHPEDKVELPAVSQDVNQFNNEDWLMQNYLLTPLDYKLEFEEGELYTGALSPPFVAPSIDPPLVFEAPPTHLSAQAIEATLPIKATIQSNPRLELPPNIIVENVFGDASDIYLQRTRGFVPVADKLSPSYRFEHLISQSRAPSLHFAHYSSPQPITSVDPSLLPSSIYSLSLFPILRLAPSYISRPGHEVVRLFGWGWFRQGTLEQQSVDYITGENVNDTLITPPITGYELHLQKLKTTIEMLRTQPPFPPWTENHRCDCSKHAVVTCSTPSAGPCMVHDPLTYFNQPEHSEEGAIIDVYDETQHVDVLKLTEPSNDPKSDYYSFLSLSQNDYSDLLWSHRLSIPHIPRLKSTCRDLKILDVPGFADICKMNKNNTKIITDKMLNYRNTMPIKKVVSVVFYNAFIDSGSCDSHVPGIVFNSNTTFVFQRWTGKHCWKLPIKQAPSPYSIHAYDEIIHTVGAKHTSFSNWLLYQLPRLLRLLPLVPTTAKILSSTNGLQYQILSHLATAGVFELSRLIGLEAGVVYFGRAVYRTETWPMVDVARDSASANTQKDDVDLYLHMAASDLLLVHHALATTLPDTERTCIVLINRKPEEGRQLENEEEIRKTIMATLPNGYHICNCAHDAFAEALTCFARARVIIGVTGGGLAHALWSKTDGGLNTGTGTAMIEVGFEGMTAMYYTMATLMGHQYYLTRGVGHKDGQWIQANINDLEWALRTIFQT